MEIRQLRPALVLSAWTFLVWTTRIRNIWTDDALSAGGQVLRTALALVFTGFALVVWASWMRGRRRGSVPRSTGPWVRAFALWTTAVWVVRGMQIVLADHGVAFVIVHTVLALVSIALAWWAFRAVDADNSVEAEPALT